MAATPVLNLITAYLRNERLALAQREAICQEALDNTRAALESAKVPIRIAVEMLARAANDQVYASPNSQVRSRCVITEEQIARSIEAIEQELDELVWSVINHLQREANEQ